MIALDELKVPKKLRPVETFVSAHPELAEADRQMLLGWRDVVEGVFEIRERDGKGSDLIVVPGPEVASRMNGFLTWYTRRVLEEAGPAASSLGADVAARTPAFSVPGDLAGAPTVALAYDETEGLMFLANFVLVREAFENPGFAADSEHRQAVLGYLKADSISALPFRRLAGADTARASQLFQHLLKKPSFSWERDGEALLRKHKPWCFGAEPQPPVTPLSSELAKALPSSV